MSITAFAGPFPTAWSSPPECSSFVSEEVIVLDAASSCLPKNFDTDTAVYYSPGTACPSGYMAQDYCSVSNNHKTTTVTCCPVRGDMTMWCVEDPGSLRPPWVDYQCTWSAGDLTTEIVVTSSSRQETRSETITMAGADGVNAYGIRMVFEPSDLSKSTSTSSVRSIESASIQPSSSSASSSTTQAFAQNTNGNLESTTHGSDPSSNGGGGLSTGAKAAIGVVIPLVVIAILVGAFLLYRRRKQQAPPTPMYGAVSMAVAGSVSGEEHKPGPLYGGRPPAGELYGSQEASYELPARSLSLTELPADVPGSHYNDHTGSMYPQRRD